MASYLILASCTPPVPGVYTYRIHKTQRTESDEKADDIDFVFFTHSHSHAHMEDTGEVDGVNFLYI